MPVRPILTIPDTRLKERADDVAVVDDEVRATLKDMLDTMYDAPGIGLAGPQIGDMRRLVVMDVSEREADESGELQGQPEPMMLVNPEIVWWSEETGAYEEGCLSIPDYYATVERPTRVKARYLDETGAAREMEADGLLATCLQHEIDHLDGVLFIDHLSRLKRDRVTRKFAKAKRDAEKKGDEKTADKTKAA